MLTGSNFICGDALLSEHIAHCRFARSAEGLTIMTNIVDCDLNAIRIGQSVRVVVKATGDDPPVPMFAPAA
jgi:hypothetical protein